MKFHFACVIKSFSNVSSFLLLLRWSPSHFGRMLQVSVVQIGTLATRGMCNCLSGIFFPSEYFYLSPFILTFFFFYCLIPLLLLLSTSLNVLLHFLSLLLSISLAIPFTFTSSKRCCLDRFNEILANHRKLRYLKQKIQQRSLKTGRHVKRHVKRSTLFLFWRTSGTQFVLGRQQSSLTNHMIKNPNTTQNTEFGQDQYLEANIIRFIRKT